LSDIKTRGVKKKKKDKSIRQNLPLRVWEDEGENIPSDAEKDQEEEENQSSDYNPFLEEDIEGD
jgi:hypothetical protein